MAPPSDREIRVHKRTFVKVREEIESLLVGKIDIESLAQIEGLYEQSLKVYADKFEDAANEFFLLVDETAKEDLELETRVVADQSEVRRNLIAIQAKIKKVSAVFKGEEARRSILPPTANSTMAEARQPEQLKLKKIEIPEFDGDLSKFYNFKALFVNLVHNNSEFTNVQKLYYLKQALVGKASIVLQDCELADDAYPEVWSYVLERFENKRAIVRTFFVKLSTLQPIRSEASIREILDQVMAIIRGLKVAGEKVDDTFSRYISFVVASKLDPITAKDWENFTCSDNRYPKFENLFKFLQGRTFVVEERKIEKPKDGKDWKELASSKSSAPKKSFLASAAKGKCPMCNGQHFLNQCGSFKGLNAHRRYDFVKSQDRCLVCFEKDHSAASCKSIYKCKCGKPHHSLLHFNFKNGSRDAEKPVENSPGKGNDTTDVNGGAVEKKVYQGLVRSNELEERIILLPSALVRFSVGNVHGVLRLLLDSCAQATMASDRLVRKYRLPMEKAACASLLGGVTPGIVSADQEVSLTLISRTECFSIDIRAEVVPPGCMNYEACAELPKGALEELSEFPLADPAVAKRPIRVGDVDLILGAEYYGRCIGDRKKQIGELSLSLSKFGWTVSGAAKKATMSSKKFVGFTLNKVESNLKSYHSMECAKAEPKVGNSEQLAFVKHFNSTYSYAPDGKFNLHMPLKGNLRRVRNNRKIALISFFRMEKKLETAPKLKLDYSKFMNEYMALGHGTLAKPIAGDQYFIPHRCVVREESLTTPVRVVFNASSHEKGWLSLNDVLMVGPQIQRELFDILISVRAYCYVFTADVEKMYRMIWIDEKDRDLQRILWRNNADETVSEFRLNTVTYGTTAASFMATQCLEKVACEIEQKEPLAAAMIRDNFYMDDLIAGGDDLQKVIHNRKVVHNALLARGFRLRKYASNVQEITAGLEAESMLSGSNVDLPESVGVLGIGWSPAQDIFCVKVELEIGNGFRRITKRIMMSWLAKVFDPLGFVAPVTLRGKLLIQKLWKEGLDWDVQVPESIAHEFLEYLQDLSKLKDFVIDRYVAWPGAKMQLVGFCDASGRAFCAMVFVRSLVDQEVKNCRLLCAKTRVAPVKEATIPKLELCSALLLAQLVDRVRSNLQVAIDDCFLFTDATIVLCWLSQPPEEWRSFVSNRVKKVHELMPYPSWFYVNTVNNPADLATRGLPTSEFLASKEWLEGPGFLKNVTISSDPIPNIDVSQALERRKVAVSVNQVVVKSDFINKFSSYTRVIRVMAYVIRFCKRSRKIRLYDEVELSVGEINEALTAVIRIVQATYFFDDISRLSDNMVLKTNSRLLPLAPFLDKSHILRVGGRLNRSSLSQSRKHPIILHARSQFVRSWIRWIHEKYFHANKKFLVAFIVARYWIVGGCVGLVKFVLRQCIVCARYKGEVVSQMMGQLPAFRVSCNRPFAHTGVDLAGPFQCKCVAHRTTRYYKIYIAIFVCMVVKCVHIEVVTDLSSAKFIETLQRFVSRRGVPSNMYSDNGTNFVGTKNLIIENQAKVRSFLVAEGIHWSMIPPRSPHFGGLWEAAVRSAKYHLTRVNAGNVLSYDQYCTLVARIEAILNSRPLCLSIGQGDDVLTPGHFLVGRPLTSVAEFEDVDRLGPLSTKLREINARLSAFWSSWRADYLNQLQKRYKWQREEPNLVPGQVVLLKDESLPCNWPMGIVEQVYPDAEGKVRVADIRVAGSPSQVFKRAISKIILLPIDVTPEPLQGSAGGVCLDRCSYVQFN